MLTRSFRQSRSRLTVSAADSSGAFMVHGSHTFSPRRTCLHRVAYYHPSAASNPFTARINPVRRTPASAFFGPVEVCLIRPVVAQLLHRRAAEEPVAVGDLVDTQARLERQRVRDHRLWCGFGRFRDVEILLQSRPGSKRNVHPATTAVRNSLVSIGLSVEMVTRRQ